MRALLIEHDAYTRPGPIGEALLAQGYSLERRLVVPEDRFHSPDVDHDFPDPGDYDLIVPMGAPWSVTDHVSIGSWLTPELTMLAAAHERQIPILGICFGAQAMTAVLGGDVVPAHDWELGWQRIHTLEPDAVPTGPWFQFHRDAMRPPNSVEVIAENAWGVQAWRQNTTLAVQFHPELTPSTLELWLAHGGEQVLIAQGVDPNQVRDQTVREEPAASARAGALVDAFIARVRG